MRKVLFGRITAADHVSRYQRRARVAAMVSALLIGSEVAAIEFSTYRISSVGALVLGLAITVIPLRESEVDRYQRRHRRLVGARPGARLGA